jgi:Spy/CpxP family protein refolding chaperone
MEISINFMRAASARKSIRTSNQGSRNGKANQMKRFLQQGTVAVIAIVFLLGCMSRPATDHCGTSSERTIGRLARHFGLTEVQRAQVIALLGNLEKARAPLQANVDQARMALMDAVKGNSSSQIGQLTGQIGSLTAQITSLEAQADANFYALLTPEQRHQWDERDRPGEECSHRRGRCR